MSIIKSLRTGDISTVVSTFLYLCVSFMAWVSLSPLMVYITRDLDISIEAKLRLSALAVVSGSLLRIPVGLLADKIGTKPTGIIVQSIALVAITSVYLVGLKSNEDILIFALFLGFSGASFAIALPQASHWYAPEYQGLVLGIVGAGNMGVALNALFSPLIAQQYDWQTAYGILAVAMAATLIIYIICSRDAPISVVGVGQDDYMGVITSKHGRLYMVIYFITFGGFVGLSASIPTLFNSQYHVSGVLSGMLAAIIVFIGSIARPIGGYLADKKGASKLMYGLLSLISLAYALLAFTNFNINSVLSQKEGNILMAVMPVLSAVLFSICSLFLGIGNGAIFQQIGKKFPSNIGAASGIIGASGGIGGFVLAEVLARSREETGSFCYGYASLCLLVGVGILWLKSNEDCMDSK